MAKYILVYEINDYPDAGGGIQVEYPKDEQEMHKRVEELHINYKDIVNILDAGFLQVEYKYEAIKYATRFEPKRV